MDYNKTEILSEDEALVQIYEKSLLTVQQREHYTRILIWLYENHVDEIHKRSLRDLEEIWLERNQKMEGLKQIDYENSKNQFNKQFLYQKPSFFIEMLLPSYPCALENIREFLRNEEIFIINLVVFYLLNDLVYANLKNREDLEDLRINFKNV